VDECRNARAGVQLARQICGLRPGMPILICAGMGESAVPDTAANMRGTLGKPFTFQDQAESPGCATVEGRSRR